jgi:hypothetical protein
LADSPDLLLQAGPFGESGLRLLHLPTDFQLLGGVAEGVLAVGSYFMPDNFGAGRTSKGSIRHWRALPCVIDHFCQDVLVGECPIGGALDLEHDIVYNLTK